MSLTGTIRNIGFGLSLGCGLWIGAASAQETTAPAEAATTATPAAEPELSMGVAPGTEGSGLKTAETAVVGETYLATRFELWEQRCIKTADGSDPCQLYQLLKDNTGNDVAEVSLFAMAPGNQAAAGASVVVPLETLLTRNLVIAIDGGETKVYPFTFCASLGCVARVGFTEAELTQLKAGAQATVTIVPAAAPDQTVALTLSLKGFTAGFEAVKATLPKQ
jgi:invasion protein IalB